MSPRSVLHPAPRLSLLATLVAVLPGCASMATQGSAARSAVSVGLSAYGTGRRVYVSRLSAREPSPTVAPEPSATAVWGTIRLVVNDDDSFEYLATLHNPGRQAVTAAVLRREGGEPGAVLATLFSETTLRGRYLQLRGTVTLRPDVRAAALIEELREHPRAFALVVHLAGGGAGGTIRGALE